MQKKRGYSTKARRKSVATFTNKLNFKWKGNGSKNKLSSTGDTRWGSHHKTIVHLLSMWSPILEVLEDIHDDNVDKKQRGTVMSLVNKMESYELVFISHLINVILGLTSELSYFLQ